MDEGKDARDQCLGSGVENYEIRFFAETNGMSIERARELILLRGEFRANLEASLTAAE